MRDVSSQTTYQPTLDYADTQPRVYYGWVMLLVSTAAMLCTSPAQSFVIAIFRPYLESSLGLTPSAFARAYMFATLAGAAPLLILGALYDRFGGRWLAVAVSILMTLGCVVVALAGGFWSLLLGMVMISMFGQAALGMLAGNILSQWFRRRLGFATGIMSASMALSIALAPTACNALIQQTDWRTGYMVLGGVVVALMLPLLLLIYREKPEDMGLQIDGGVRTKGRDKDAHADHDVASLTNASPADDAMIAELDPSQHDDERHFTVVQAFRTRAFWITNACFAWWGIAITAIMISGSAIFEAQGLSSAHATGAVATMLGAMGFTLLCTQLIAGRAADVFSVQRIMGVGMVLVACACLAVAMEGSHHYVIGIGILMGLAHASMVAVMGTIWPRYYGREHIGKIRGLVIKNLIITSGVGPFAVELVNTVTQSHQLTFFCMAFVPIPLLVAAMFATRPDLPPNDADTTVTAEAA